MTHDWRTTNREALADALQRDVGAVEAEHDPADQNTMNQDAPQPDAAGERPPHGKGNHVRPVGYADCDECLAEMEEPDAAPQPDAASGVAATDEEAERARAVVAPPQPSAEATAGPSLADRDQWRKWASDIILTTPVSILGTAGEPDDYAGAKFLADLIDAEATLRAEVERLTANKEELAQWHDVFLGYFGPEGGDLMIADKGVQDLVAELNMARDDIERLRGERGDMEKLSAERFNEVTRLMLDLTKAEGERDALATSLRYVKTELGVPNRDYPNNVTNAWHIADAALTTAERERRAALGEAATPSPHERLRDALGKPAVSMRWKGGGWAVNVFRSNGVEGAVWYPGHEEALDFLREELGE